MDLKLLETLHEKVNLYNFSLVEAENFIDDKKISMMAMLEKVQLPWVLLSIGLSVI